MILFKFFKTSIRQLVRQFHFESTQYSFTNHNWAFILRPLSFYNSHCYKFPSLDWEILLSPQNIHGDLLIPTWRQDCFIAVFEFDHTALSHRQMLVFAFIFSVCTWVIFQSKCLCCAKRIGFDYVNAIELKSLFLLQSDSVSFEDMAVNGLH